MVIEKRIISRRERERGGKGRKGSKKRRNHVRIESELGPMGSRKRNKRGGKSMSSV